MNRTTKTPGPFETDTIQRQETDRYALKMARKADSDLARLAHKGNRATAEAYLREIRALGSTLPTIAAYAYTLRRLSEHLGKPYKAMTRDDARAWTEALLRQYPKGASAKFHAQNAQAFLNRTKTAPAAAAFLEEWTVSIRKKGLARAEERKPLIPDEFRAMLAATTSEQEQAILLLLEEAGHRRGAINLMNVGSLTFERREGIEVARIKVNDGGNPLEFVAINAAPLLRRRMNTLPGRDNPSAPFWRNQHPYDPADPEASRLGRDGVYFIVRRAAKRAGIRRPIYPHLFRHTKATSLAKRRISPALANKLMGWNPKSTMWLRYSHVTAEDALAERLAEAGIKAPEPVQATDFKPIPCPRCNATASPTDAICAACSFVLDPTMAATIADQRREEQRQDVLGALQDVLARSNDGQAQVFLRVLRGASKANLALTDVRMDEQQHVKAILTDEQPRQRAKA